MYLLSSIYRACSLLVTVTLILEFIINNNCCHNVTILLLFIIWLEHVGWPIVYYTLIQLSCLTKHHILIFMFRKRWTKCSGLRTWRKTKWRWHSRRHSTRSGPLVPRSLGPFYGAIPVPSVTHGRCCYRCRRWRRRGHRCAGGVRQCWRATVVTPGEWARSGKWAQHFSNASCLLCSSSLWHFLISFLFSRPIVPF